ncbi:type VI secretion system amidase effector protein Tae4 [Rhizobium sp. R635]|uniref:type VI secretion system amidase effector protein Tae4 n=1 Tax=Rhizobium sp. R635 TaxID=1764275 RepID=UPI001FD89AA0|nr:type VI secretion system amidase effector protein Tae4 [Rhizobium sp. R635]
MINVAFDTLYANYPSSATYRPNYVSQEDLFREIGWDALLNNPLYANTCAVRVSLALVRSGIKISPKSHNILKGPHANKGLEVSMRRLADLLATTLYLGNYESYTSATAQSGIGARKGVVAFNGIPGYRGGGHIDLVTGAADAAQCASSCYYQSQSIWFWPLLSSRTS